MIFIAQRSKEGGRVGIREIAAGIDSPEHFIAKILQDLTREGILLSVKGPNGGFYLDEDKQQCSLADIVRAVDGDALFTGCGLGLKQCSETHPCPIHHEFKALRMELQRMLEDARLDEFTEELEMKMTFLRR